MYWRMQLHPSDSEYSVSHSIDCLSAGYIGLDFDHDIGDMKKIKHKDGMPEGQQRSWDFAHRMKTGDRVLIIAHHYPFALATVAGPYNYILHPDPYIGWFRHFHAVKDIAFYADYMISVKKWPKIIMTDTISPLVEEDTASFTLIRKWLEFLGTAG